MKKLLAIAFASLFAVSTGAFAAAHMAGEKGAKKGDKMEKMDKKDGKKKDGKKKGGDKK